MMLARALESRPFSRFFSTIFLTVALAACVGLPETELRTFLASAQESRDAGRDIYEEVGRVIYWNSNKDKAPSANKCDPDKPLPACFDPTMFLTKPPVIDRDIEARILAYEVVVLYTEAILSINSGQSAQAVEGKVQQLGEAAGKVVALSPVSTGSLAGFVTEPVMAGLAVFARKLETVRGKAVAASAIKSDSALIKDIIAFLIKDTSDVYSLYSKLQLQFARTREGGPTGADGQQEFARIKAMHASLAALTAHLDKTSEALDTLLSTAAAKQTDLVAINLALDQALELKLSAKQLQGEVAKLKK